MRRIRGLLLAAVVLAGLMVMPAAGASAASLANTSVPQTYTVVVGAEDAAHGVELEAYFPSTVTIHVGDTVHWVQNAREIHTVTFLAGTKMPDLAVPAPRGAVSPVMLNPQAAFPAIPAHGLYSGAGYASSGVMGLAPGQMPEFNLTFTKAGIYEYICLVHGKIMSGKVIVQGAAQAVPSPADTVAQANNEMVQLWAQVPEVVAEAQRSIKPATKNADGTLTQYISMGYAKGQIDLMQFFPAHIAVHPGDTIEWSPSDTDMAPHTVTFVNGAPDPELLTVQPQKNGPPLLLLNPALMFPSNAGKPLMDTGYYNSGLIDPTLPGPHTFSLKIGDFSGVIEFDCALHDASGMTGTFVVASRH